MLGFVLTPLALLAAAILAAGVVGFGPAAALRSESFERRFVGTATPTCLGLIRVLAFSAMTMNALWEDVGSAAALPTEIRQSMGVADLLLLFPGLLASEEALDVFQGVTIVLLVLATLGVGTRWAVPLAAVSYLLMAGVPRMYSWFYHVGWGAACVGLGLAFTPCGDGFSLDRLLKRRLGKSVVPDEPAAVYGWSRYLCWTVLALPYTIAGLSKLRAYGFRWADPVNFRPYMYQDSLDPMQFSFDGGLQLVHAPDFLVWGMGLSALLGETLFVLVLFSRVARVVLPVVTIGMHVGILFMQNILFHDLILLQAMYLIPGTVRFGASEAISSAWARTESPIVTSGNRSPYGSPVAGSIESGPVEPAHPPSTLAQTMKSRAGSIGRPDPISDDHHPFFVSPPSSLSRTSCS